MYVPQKNKFYGDLKLLKVFFIRLFIFNYLLKIHYVRIFIRIDNRLQNCQSNDHNFFQPISPLFGSNYTRFKHYSFLSFSVVNTKNNVIGIFSDFFLMEEYK